LKNQKNKNERRKEEKWQNRGNSGNKVGYKINSYTRDKPAPVRGSTSAAASWGHVNPFYEFSTC
jgi:hypothetical protein